MIRKFIVSEVTSRIIYMSRNLMFVFLLLSALCYAQNKSSERMKSSEKKEEYCGIGFMKSMFPNVDVKDAAAAIKVYISELQRLLDIDTKLKAVLFENTDDLIKNFDKENIAVLNIGSVDYMKIHSRLRVTPRVVGFFRDSPLEEYLLLVKNSGKINSLHDLANKNFGIFSQASNPVPCMWLDNLLLNNKMPVKEKLFKSITENNTESNLIMSVFFGQMDACMVSKNAFMTVIELNPQIERQLKILAQSPGYLRAVSCFSNDIMRSRLGEVLFDGSLRISTYSSGKQLFTLMRTQKVVPFREEYLNTVKKLVSDQNSLTGRK